MAELRWIKTSLFLILVLQFTAAATEQRVLFTVRDGDEVTLPCDSLIDDHKNCDSIWWGFDDLRRAVAVFLVKDGKIHDEAKDKSDRLSVSEKCSLVIKNVTDEDVGRYQCIQYKSGQKQVAVVYLSVVTMTEHKVTDEVTVNCSVSTYERCTHRVKWLLEGQDVDKDNKDFMTSRSSCSASLKFNTSRFNSLICEVTDGVKVQKFPLRNSPSGDKTGEDTTITTEDTTSGKTTTTSAICEDSPELQSSCWRFLFVHVGLAALIIIVVAINMWARMKEKKTQTDEIAMRYDAEDETVNYENTGPPDGVCRARLPPSDRSVSHER